VKKILLCIISLLILSAELFAQKYVATDGSDTNPGTIDLPFKTIAKAISVAVPGDTIYVRGGGYSLTNTISISSSKSGSESQRYFLIAYPNERPLLDFSNTPNGIKGIRLNASYWHIKGFDVKGSGDNGLEISGGSNNIIELCSFYENRDSGMQLSNGASNNQIINCDSYYNADPPDYADADGFAPKLDVGTGNSFSGCRAWGNVDDGWDGYMRGANDVATTLENCWTWGNGYLKDGTDPGSQANGNGFKMGGGDNGNSDSLMHHFILKNCLAFGNKNKGFDQNNNLGSMTLLNCTGYNNKEANYRIQRALNPGQTLTVKNCVSFTGAVQLGSFAIQETNGWMSPFVVTVEDFLSIDPASASSPRKAGGSLPTIDFLHLASGSDLIDAGVDLGMPFNGNAPDLGAFESPFTTAVDREEFIPSNFRLYQNYPNPFNPSTVISFQLSVSSEVNLAIYNINGQLVKQAAMGKYESGRHEVRWDGTDDRGIRVASGAYLYVLRVGEFTAQRKLLLVK
jgi:hypothetical protein